MGSGAAGRQRQWTVALVTVAALLESADQALLPAVYKEVGEALGASPTALGSITLCRVFVMAVCYPLSTCAAARYDRARIVAVGAFLWSVATVLVGVSGTFLQMAMARGFNGVGLALVLPAIFSLVADYSDDATRGSAFGWVQMAQCKGYVLGRSLGVLLAPTTFLGVPGWRLAFHILALVSLLLAALTWLLAADPRPRSSAKATATAADLAAEAKGVVSVPTFWIIVAQGAAGCLPWAALNFAAMWLELVGFTHWETTLIANLSSLANALGSVFAGFAGDPMARRFPDTGRIVLAQVSTALTVPLAAVVLLALPGNPSGCCVCRRFLLPGLRHAMEPRLHQLSYIRGDRAGEGEDHGVRAAQVLPDGVRVVRDARRGHPGGERLWISADRVRRERRSRPEKRRRAGQGHLRRDRRAGHHLLPHVHRAVLDLPRGQTARADGSSAGGVGGPGRRL